MTGRELERERELAVSWINGNRSDVVEAVQGDAVLAVGVYAAFLHVAEDWRHGLELGGEYLRALRGGELMTTITRTESGKRQFCRGALERGCESHSCHTYTTITYSDGRRFHFCDEHPLGAIATAGALRREASS